jgi:hypothetical protein
MAEAKHFRGCAICVFAHPVHDIVLKFWLAVRLPARRAVPAES